MSSLEAGKKRTTILSKRKIVVIQQSRGSIQEHPSFTNDPIISPSPETLQLEKNLHEEQQVFTNDLLSRLSTSLKAIESIVTANNAHATNLHDEYNNPIANCLKVKRIKQKQEQPLLPLFLSTKKLSETSCQFHTSSPIHNSKHRSDASNGLLFENPLLNQSLRTITLPNMIPQQANQQEASSSPNELPQACVPNESGLQTQSQPSIKIKLIINKQKKAINNEQESGISTARSQGVQTQSFYALPLRGSQFETEPKRQRRFDRNNVQAMIRHHHSSFCKESEELSTSNSSNQSHQLSQLLSPSECQIEAKRPKLKVETSFGFSNVDPKRLEYFTPKPQSAITKKQRISIFQPRYDSYHEMPYNSEVGEKMRTNSKTQKDENAKIVSNQLSNLHTTNSLNLIPIGKTIRDQIAVRETRSPSIFAQTMKEQVKLKDQITPHIKRQRHLHRFINQHYEGPNCILSQQLIKGNMTFEDDPLASKYSRSSVKLGKEYSIKSRLQSPGGLIEDRFMSKSERTINDPPKKCSFLEKRINCIS